jgi:hypothetical protein
MGNLNNIRRHAVKPGKLVSINLDMISADHKLPVEHLGQANFGFVNDSLRGSGSESIKLAQAAKGQLTPEGLVRVREANRETVAKHSVRSHSGFCYDGPDGEPDKANPVPSTPAGIAEVVNALPDDIFDQVLAFVLNPENFRERPIEAKAEDIAKKS